MSPSSGYLQDLKQLNVASKHGLLTNSSTGSNADLLEGLVIHPSVKTLLSELTFSDLESLKDIRPSDASFPHTSNAQKPSSPPGSTSTFEWCPLPQTLEPRIGHFPSLQTLSPSNADLSLLDGPVPTPKENLPLAYKPQPSSALSASSWPVLLLQSTNRKPLSYLTPNSPNPASTGLLDIQICSKDTERYPRTPTSLPEPLPALDWNVLAENNNIGWSSVNPQHNSSTRSDLQLGQFASVTFPTFGASETTKSRASAQQPTRTSAFNNLNPLKNGISTSSKKQQNLVPSAIARASPAGALPAMLTAKPAPELSPEDKLAIAPLDTLIPTLKTGTALTSTGTNFASRTTNDVIADLKRPLHVAQLSLIKHRKASQAAELNKNKRYVEQWVSGVKTIAPDGEAEDGEQDGWDDQDDEEHEISPPTKPRQITERKRRLNAIADSHIQDSIQKALKAGVSSVKSGQETQQSARWLVNQSESHKIISTPREYQTELFERAKEKNIIAVLDTGSGKTLIAVLLLRHIFAQELEDRAFGKPKRVSFFLVDSVALVFQQHAVLKANLDQPMNMFCGDMGCDLWNRALWEKHFNENMVIVCTAEVLRQCLHHSFISMDRINLLIFDEAHHAKKDHSYARIIKDFYAQDKHPILPKIFGMTASPVDARTDVRKAAAELEGLLHCQIATAADEMLGGFKINSKLEAMAIYDTLGPKFETPLYEQMRERFDKNTVFRKPLLFSREASRELGAWCSDQVWPFCLNEEEAKKLLAKTERQYHGRKIREPLEVLENRKALLEEAREIVKNHKFEEPDFSPPSGIEHRASSNNLSSKVVLLVNYLRERFERPTDDKAIVFVQQRYTARMLAKLFSHPNIGTTHLKVGTLVGTRTGDAGDLNASFRDHVLTMANFRNGSINCLFATSVAEEGLDIPDCNLVIRFDLYTTLIQYIQSRGRARHANSRYIHMLEAGNHEHIQIAREVRVNENILTTFCRALPEDRKLTGNNFNMDHFLAKEKSHRVFIVPETGAKLTYKMSLMVLANFVDSLPHGPESMLNPEYIVTTQNKKFIGEVILPESSPIRGAIGRSADTKAVAKCSAAFETCVLLRQGKYLDENLLPIFTKQLPAMRNALLAVDSKAKEAYDMRNKPNLWSIGGDPEELFITVLGLDKPECLDRRSQPLALLTRSPLPQLPSFFLHFGADRHSPVQLTSITQSLQADASILTQVNRFTLYIFEHVFSKKYFSNQAKMPYFLAPIKAHGVATTGSDPFDVIAWDILHDTLKEFVQWGEKPWENMAWKDAPPEYFEDKFIVDPWDGSRKLWSIGIASQYKPLDPVPANSAARKGTKMRKEEYNKNIMEYSISLFSKARAKRIFDPNQPVVAATLVSLNRNFLDEFDGTVDKPKGCFVIIEPLTISPLPATIVAMAYLFPAIIHRVESYLIALDACALLQLSIRPDLALEAMTKDSDNSHEHGEEKINFQRGMGNNYERLEFLGDCFLKMATSISLYGIHPENDEYAYHVDRMMLICNKNLRNNAVKLKLYEYIRSYSFNRRAWYPEGLVLEKGKAATAPDSAKLGDKTIADVCEALIGAALLSTPGNMDNAVRAVSELVSSENHQISSWDDYYKLYKKPKYQTAPTTQMQINMAMQIEQQHSYHFKYPRLLRSAFTHPSYPFSYEHVPSYQRLEFLGDALLDMACINFLFHSFPDRDPQWLTEHKMAMVSNQFLGALCVSLNWHTHLCIFNTTFSKQIADYVTDVREARRQAEEDAVRAGKDRSDCSPDYWTHVRQPPKCLPDLIEAYVGAMFVDSEYDYPLVERFFDEHIKWYFKDMSIYDTFANKHPTTFLTKFLQIDMGCMDWSIVVRNIPNIDGSKPQVMAVVMVHSQVVADKTAESSRYAKVGAAQQALAILKGLPLPEFREKYRCECCLNEISDELTDEHMHGTAV